MRFSFTDFYNLFKGEKMSFSHNTEADYRINLLQNRVSKIEERLDAFEMYKLHAEDQFNSHIKFMTEIVSQLTILLNELREQLIKDSSQSYGLIVNEKHWVSIESPLQPYHAQTLLLKNKENGQITLGYKCAIKGVFFDLSGNSLADQKSKATHYIPLRFDP